MSFAFMRAFAFLSQTLHFRDDNVVGGYCHHHTHAAATYYFMIMDDGHKNELTVRLPTKKLFIHAMRR